MPVSLEAAGPASPRLIMEEVTFRLDSDGIRASVRLARGQQRFEGTAAGRAERGNTWKLAAAASVAAMQQCLQQVNSGPATPQVQLLDVATHTTGIGQEYIAAAVRVTFFGKQTDLLGSALVRNDRSRAAVAAALDATHRLFGRAGGRSACNSAADRAGEDVADGVQPEATTHTAKALTSGTPGQIEPVEAPLVESHAAIRGPQDATNSVPPGYPALGVAITATSVQASVVNSDGAVLANTRRDLDAPATREAALALAAEAAREVFDDVMQSHEVTSLGLALDGCPDERGEIAHPPAGVSAWGALEPFECLAQEFALPTAAITASDAAAFAEFSFGAAGGISDMLHVRVGDDIELALLARGSPLATAQGLPINAAHVVIDRDGPQCACGESGCWQALASAGALVARAVNALRGGAASAISAAADGRLDDVTPSLVVRMAAAGDPVARRALQETARYFALGLVNMIALFGPQAVVIDSRPPAVGAALLRAAEGALKSSPRAGLLSHCVLLTSELGESASVLGAAAWAARCAS